MLPRADFETTAEYVTLVLGLARMEENVYDDAGAQRRNLHVQARGD
jgi:hypothetical protein